MGDPKPIRELRRRVIGLAQGKVLEIGSGAGANFTHYDPARVTKLYALEPNPNMIANAAAVAAALAASPAVESVHYPGLSSHPGHDIARRQMRNFGGMLSFLVRGSRSEALRVASRTKRTGQVALANRRLERTKFHQQTVVYPRVQGLYSLYLNNTGKCIKFGYSLGTAERGKLAFFSL
jgi:hypothetical protein